MPDVEQNNIVVIRNRSNKTDLYQRREAKQNKTKHK